MYLVPVARVEGVGDVESGLDVDARVAGREWRAPGQVEGAGDRVIFARLYAEVTGDILARQGVFVGRVIVFVARDYADVNPIEFLGVAATGNVDLAGDHLTREE